MLKGGTLGLFWSLSPNFSKPHYTVYTPLKGKEQGITEQFLGLKGASKIDQGFIGGKKVRKKII